MQESALILGKQLEAARKEIETLRKLTNYTVAIIVAAGGRVEMTSDEIENWSKRDWRHENDGTLHVFSALSKARGEQP